MTRATRETEKPPKPKRKAARREPTAWQPLPSLYTTLHFSPTILLSLQDHLKAFSLRHIKQLFLRQLLHDILRILFYVFHEVLYPERKYDFICVPLNISMRIWRSRTPKISPRTILPREISP